MLAELVHHLISFGFVVLIVMVEQRHQKLDCLVAEGRIDKDRPQERNAVSQCRGG